jgi:hypothetical protein
MFVLSKEVKIYLFLRHDVLLRLKVTDSGQMLKQQKKMLAIHFIRYFIKKFTQETNA